jgi:hypothetical protein
MISTKVAAGLFILVAAACSRQNDQAPNESAAETNLAAANGAPATAAVANEAPASSNGAEQANVAQPPRASLPEPKGPIDPKSIEAAGQVVQHYGALIEQKRWTESRRYWGSAEAARAFERNFRTYANVHLEIGDLGETEGAAGSIFTTVPATFYGDLNSGGTGRLKTNIVLRRVNDVPGSTEAQRRWHIERIEPKG